MCYWFHKAFHKVSQIKDPDTPKTSPYTESYVLFSLLTFIPNSLDLIAEWSISSQSPHSFKER